MKNDANTIAAFLEEVYEYQKKAYLVRCKYDELESLFLKENVFIIKEGEGAPLLCKDAILSEEAKKIIAEIKKILTNC